VTDVWKVHALFVSIIVCVGSELYLFSVHSRQIEKLNYDVGRLEVRCSAPKP